MVSGTPVIVLDHGGPRTLAASATDPGRVQRIEPGTLAQTVRRLAEAMTLAAKGLPSAITPLIDQAAAQRSLRGIFESLGFPLGRPSSA